MSKEMRGDRRATYNTYGLPVYTYRCHTVRAISRKFATFDSPSNTGVFASC